MPGGAGASGSEAELAAAELHEEPGLQAGGAAAPGRSARGIRLLQSGLPHLRGYRGAPRGAGAGENRKRQAAPADPGTRAQGPDRLGRCRGRTHRGRARTAAARRGVPGAVGPSGRLETELCRDVFGKHPECGRSGRSAPRQGSGCPLAPLALSMCPGAAWGERPDSRCSWGPCGAATSCRAHADDAVEHVPAISGRAARATRLRVTTAGRRWQRSPLPPGLRQSSIDW